MLQASKNPHYWLGIAWYPQLVKLALFQSKGRNTKIIGLDHLELPSEEPEALGLAVATWVSKNLPGDAVVSAVLSLPESAIFLKELTIPSTDPEAIDTAIRWEIPVNTPLNSGQAVYQWQLLSAEGKEAKVAVMIIKDELAQKLYDSLTQAGLKLLAIEPFSVSLSRLNTATVAPSTLLMSVDEGEVNYVVLKQGLPVFSTSGGATIKKLAVGSRNLAEESVSSLAESAAAAMNFWQEQGQGKIDQVLITGDVAKYYGLSTAVYRRTKIPAFMAKSRPIPVDKTSKLSQAAYQRFLIPAGAAYRALAPATKKAVNLFPQKELTKLAAVARANRYGFWLRGLALLNLGLISLSLMLWILAGIYGASVKADMAQTRQFIDNHPAQAYLSPIKDANATLTAVDSLLSAHKVQGLRLVQIAELTPTNVVIKTVTFTGKKQDEWVLEGVGDRDQILAFYEKIRTDGGVDTVTLTYSSLEQPEQAKFTLEVVWP